MKKIVIIAAGCIAIGAVAMFLSSSSKPAPPDALSPLPAPYYSVLFENDQVRVVEHRLEPGQSEPMHSHPPMVVICTEDADVRVSGPDGEAFDESPRKGQVVEVGPLSHAMENVGNTPLRSILVELKPGTAREDRTPRSQLRGL
jgi:quercetin dioxygenase-like cupin family protein